LKKLKYKRQVKRTSGRKMLRIDHHNRQSWTAFEASVLVQQTFDSIAIPFAGWAKLDWYLKLWNKRILDNDIFQWAWWVARARVENNSDQLSESDLKMILKEADRPEARLSNPALRNWFSEDDACWLDNIRANIEELSSETRKALSILGGILIGDYILSFTPETQSLRRPLPEIFSSLLAVINRIIDNQCHNSSYNFEAREFVIRTKADLLFVNLPAPGSMLNFLHSRQFWRESWVRGHGNVYEELYPVIKESFGGVVLSKERYLQILVDLLERAKHMPKWAIGLQEAEPLLLNEVSETIRKFRPLQATYLKDTTDVIGGAKSYIILAVK
jgi:hypothetical protein